MAQQTSVDIAFKKLANQGLLLTKDYKNLVAYREAKEMEKQQIMNAFDIRKVDIAFDKKTTSEQYYNETYGK